jgi:hypothetical protein
MTPDAWGSRAFHRSDPTSRMLVGIARIQRRSHTNTQLDIEYYCRAYGTTLPRFLGAVAARCSPSFARRVLAGAVARNLDRKRIVI